MSARASIEANFCARFVQCFHKADGDGDEAFIDTASFKILINEIIIDKKTDEEVESRLSEKMASAKI